MGMHSSFPRADPMAAARTSGTSVKLPRGPSSAAILIVLVLQAGCAFRGGTPRIVGDWRGVGDRNAGTSLVFDETGSAVWTIGGRPMAIRYSYERGAALSRLNLFDFAEGPLKGRILYCIIAFSGQRTFKMDCEPGPAGDDRARPRAFNSEQIQLFRRSSR
jgi:hypothetical protein